MPRCWLSPTARRPRRSACVSPPSSSRANECGAGRPDPAGRPGWRYFPAPPQGIFYRVRGGVFTVLLVEDARQRREPWPNPPPSREPDSGRGRRRSMRCYSALQGILAHVLYDSVRSKACADSEFKLQEQAFDNKGHACGA